MQDLHANDSFMKIINYIVRSGINKDYSYQLRRQLLMTNSISMLITALVCLFLLLKYLFIGNWVFNFSVYVITIITYLSPIFLNRFSLITLSRLILCISPVLLILYQFIIPLKLLSTVESSMYDGARLYLIAIGMLPYLLFERKNIWLLSLAIAPSFLSILFFDEIMSLAGVGYKQLGLVDSDYPAMWLRSLISYMACSSICFLFSSVVTTNDTINQKLIHKLDEKGKELSELNQNLEKLVEIKTQILSKQNEALSNYAFTNSHKLRGPIARILGLISISKLDKELTFQWYVDKIEIEINEVDRLTKETSSRLALIDIEDKK